MIYGTERGIWRSIRNTDILTGFRHMASQPIARRIAAVAILCGALAACSPQSSTAAASTPQASGTVAAAAAPATATAATPLVSGLPDFTGLVEKYGPAVVNIDVVSRREATSGSFQGPPGMSPDDPFYDFFRRFGIPTPRGGNLPPARGEGSGFIVTPDGYILTNAHVIDDATDVTVRLTDRREFKAKVIGSDKRTDVAVIKIDAKNLPTVKIGDPSKLRAGQWVIAIGSPFGFDNSVTAGIVSGISRSLPDDNYVPFIQTDVAVNPGNSGGPLFNLAGEVVGINSQIYSRSGGYMGLSFAIPIDVAVGVRDQLIKTGRVSRGRIGVTVQEVNAQFADSFGLDRPRGALVGSVEEGGPGDKGGLKPGDVILSVNGQDVERSAQLPGIIANIKPGTKASIEVWRDKAKKRLEVKVAELDEPMHKVAMRGGDDSDNYSKLGIAVRPLDPREKAQIDTSGNLVIEDVDGPAAIAGLQRGDIILGINGRSVSSVRDLQAEVRKADKAVALRIERNGTEIFVPIRIGE
ncbi:MAG: Periplasmic pH-dependent serine endoprotease DegQ [Steroidobacteraceae bacterium]|nr:Periplasmic pH-dependent serine endoprotease DegQ [Steroidobacteraceae bacterium]